MSSHATDYSLASETKRSNAIASLGQFVRSLVERFPSTLQSLLSIFDQAIVSGTSFLSAVIVGRVAMPDELGLYYLILSIVVVAAAIQDSAVWAPYLVYCKRREGRELAEYSGSVWVSLFALTGLSALLLVAAIGIVSMTEHTRMLPGLWALLAAAPLILLRQGIRRFSFANLHVYSAIVLDGVVAVVQIGGFLALAYFGKMTLPGIMAVMGAACGLACVGTYLLDRPQVSFVKNRIGADWRHNWAFSKWTLRSYLVGYTAPYVLLWILGLTAGAAAAGVLGLCTTLIGMTNVLVMGVDNVLTPQATHAFSTKGSLGLRRILFRMGAFLLLALGGFFLVIATTGDWLTVMAFGEAGRGTGLILTVLALSAVLNCVGVVAGNGLWAIDQPRPNFLADLFCMVVTLVASLLILPLGALGAALATLAGLTAAAIARALTLAYYLPRADELRARSAESETEGRPYPLDTAEVVI